MAFDLSRRGFSSEANIEAGGGSPEDDDGGVTGFIGMRSVSESQILMGGLLVGLGVRGLPTSPSSATKLKSASLPLTSPPGAVFGGDVSELALGGTNGEGPVILSPL